jgi:7,8-dihydropterin-6-yl-methyl-4-(beta-D-ribofuranosyl)aminobenzene 5'-phosphate synthase
MCDDAGTLGEDVAASRPRQADGPAVDPISLEPVDEVVITTLMDNSFDALMGDMGPAQRARLARASVPAPQFLNGSTVAGLIAVARLRTRCFSTPVCPRMAWPATSSVWS